MKTMTTVTTMTVFGFVDGAAESLEVESTKRARAIDAVFGDADVYYLDLSDDSRPRWAVSTSRSEGLVPAEDVERIPAAIREAVGLWWAARVGADCAREWHAVEPGTVPEGVPYRDWAAALELPADGDVEALESALYALERRSPTDDEREAFAEALLVTLWDLTTGTSGDAA
jgi:hypothetical protein